MVECEYCGVRLVGDFYSNDYKDYVFCDIECATRYVVVNTFEFLDDMGFGVYSNTIIKDKGYNETWIYGNDGDFL